MDFNEFLNKSLEFEEKGYKFYQDAAAKGKNAVTREIFEFLARSEIMHIDSIKKFASSAKSGGGFPDLNLNQQKKERDSDMLLFSNKISGLKCKVSAADSEIKIYDFAIDLENSAYKYYAEMRENTKDGESVKLLDFLLAEEKKHYELLMNVRSYMTDSANWNMYEEKSFPQG